LAANDDLSASAAREAGKRELAEKDVAEARRLLALAKEEASRAVVEAVKVKKMAEEKLSSSAAELAALQIAKEQVEAELDQNYEESEELLKHCFDRAVRQAHVLYGGRRPLVNVTWTTRFTMVGWFRVSRWGLWRHRRFRRPGPMRGRSAV